MRQPAWRWIFLCFGELLVIAALIAALWPR